MQFSTIHLFVYWYLNTLYVIVCYAFSCPNYQPFNCYSHQHFQVFKTDRNSATKKSLEALNENLNRVQSSSDLRAFLEKHVKWNVTIQLRLTSNTTNHSLEFADFSTSSEECSHSLDSNLFSRKRICAEKYENDDGEDNAENRNSDDDKNTDNDNADGNNTDDGYNCSRHKPKGENQLTYSYAVFIAMGIISLLGNGAAIMYEIRTFTKQSTRKAKEEKIYNMLVLNLCFADLLMGIYLIIFSLSYLLQHFYCFNINLCNALGIISTLSIQVSMSVIVVTAAYRLYSVLYPFKPIRIKVAVILMVLIWIVWLVVAIVPVFNETLFAHKFTREVIAYPKDKETICKSSGKPKFPIHSMSNIINNVEILANASIPNDSLFSRVISQSNKHQTHEVMVQLLTSFNLIDLEKSRMEFLGYYRIIRGCSVDIFFTAKDGYNKVFSLVLLSSSITGYLFVAIVYSFIFKNISTSELKSFLPCVSKNSSFKERKELPQTQTRVDEDRQIFVRIFVIVVTDVIFGIFVCLVGFGYFFYSLANPDSLLERGKNFRNSFYKWAIIVTMVLFPLNSVINPYIYCSHLWRKVCCCYKK